MPKNATNRRNTFKPQNNKQTGDIEGRDITWSSLGDFFKNRRLQKAIGLFFLLLSIFLLLAFSSYLFSWKADDAILNGRALNWELLTDTSVQADNMMGRLGAIMSHLFIKQWFGISSFLFLLIFFLWGFRLLTNIRLLHLGRTLAISLFILIWTSVFFGYIISAGDLLILGGTFGYEAARFLNGLSGKAGTAIILLFTMGTFVIIAFDPSLRALNKMLPLRIKGLFPGKSKPEAEDQPENNGMAISSQEEEETGDLRKEEDHHEGQPDDQPYDNPLTTHRAEGALSDDPGTETIDTGARSETEDPELEIEIANGKITGSDYQEIREPFQSDSNGEQDMNQLGEYDPTLDLPRYRLPDLSLLDDRGSGNIQINKQELEDNKNRIIETLRNYAIEIDRIKATVGPTVTLYEIVPAPGIRISKIKNLENDIALSLSALGIRIIAPIPGRGTIGIEVPNSNPEIVSMKSILGSERFRNSGFDLPIGLGKTIANETFIADLTKMPHLLMAGATGQGKSVGLNAILTSILYKKHPAYVKFVLVDPKKVELNLFSKIERHYLAKLPDAEEAIVTETRQVVRTINSLCVEMDNRYDLLKDAQARNIKEYNTKFIARKLNPNEGHRFLPYIILFIDEFADLIMTAGKEIELPIARLAQLARAVGLHLVIATQRPSVNIITGTIKANFPARIAFRVTAKVDSRTILDSGGADQLVGRGDMLLSTGSDLIRLQCAFIDTHEIERITEFIGSQRAYPDAFNLPEYFDDDSSIPENMDPSERDELFADAARIIVATQQGSTSLIQRKLKLGYNRAGRIIDQLEAAGIVGPFEGSKAREVKIKDEITLEQILRQQE
ncbi:MAG: DNA translocase FtsK [Bacteroidia bacterium]|nr:MAG: DNA translocase FtsK [Bacteroidia bacterium]